MASTMQKQRSGVNTVAPQQPLTPRSFLSKRLKTLKGRFLLQAGLILLLAGIMTLVASTSVNRASSDLVTIDQGSIPSVNYAQSMAQLVSEIDAQAADFLATAALSDQRSCSIPTNLNSSETVALSVHDCDARDIDAETVLLNEQLFNAEHNVTYTGERTAVERISTGLENYLGDIHQMRVDYDLAQSKSDPHDPYLQQAYQAYQAGSTVLHDRIDLLTLSPGQVPLDTEVTLPTCTTSASDHQQLTPDQWTQGSLSVALDCLSDINHAALQTANTDADGFLDGTFWWLLILGLLLGGLLVFSTGRMMATTHRVINPGLLPAALIVLILGVSMLGLVNSLGKLGDHSSILADPAGNADLAGSIDGAFQQMVSDDYDSVYDTAILTRYATDANADESRWLVAREFNDQPAIQHWQDDWRSNVDQVQSWMQNANNNLTWSEEQQPLGDMATYWGQYIGIDSQIRSDAINQSDPQHLLTAERLSTGDSNVTFSHFTHAVSQLSAADQSHYNTTRDATSQALTTNFILSLVLFPLAGLLGAWGIWLRLKDF